MRRRSAPNYRNKSEQISDILMSWIIDRRLRPGDMLGTEAELLAQHQVSRPTLRESLRMLEARGVVNLRPGPGGGVIVGRPNIDGLAHALSVFLYLNNVPFGVVLRARKVIEPALAYEAAVNGTDAEFDALGASIERMQKLTGEKEFLAENRVFHEIIAHAARNSTLESLWAAISLLVHGEQHGISYSFGNRLRVVQAHEEIVRACRSRDPAAVAACMAGHVDELEHLVRRRFHSVLEEPTQMMMNAAA